MEGDSFSNTEAANHYLVKGSPTCVLEIHELLATIWNAALKTADSIRTGLPQAKIDYSGMSQDELRQFFRGEHPYAIEYARDLLERYDFSSYRKLLDVGGGSGGASNCSDGGLSLYSRDGRRPADSYSSHTTLYR